MLKITRKTLEQWGAIPAPPGVYLAKGGRLDFVKAVIETPLTAEGKVDYDRVPAYASIWVTVTDEASPLHGRPILITKLPDERFAVTGGSGFSAWKDDLPPEEQSKRAQAQAARKHLPVTGGKPKGTAADVEKETERRRVVEENEPFQEAARAARREVRKLRKKARSEFEQATGMTEEVSRATLKKIRAQVAGHVEGLGLEEDQSRTFANEVTRQLRKRARSLKSRVAARRARAALDVQRFADLSQNFEETKPMGGEEGQGQIGLALHQETAQEELTRDLSFDWDYSSVVEQVAQAAQEKGEELTEPQIQHIVAKHGEEAFSQAIRQFEEHGSDVSKWEPIENLTPRQAEPAGAEEPTVEGKPAEGAITIDVAQPLDVEDRDALQGAIDAFVQMEAAKRREKEARSQIRPVDIEMSTPQALEELRVELDIPSDEDLAALMERYERRSVSTPAPDRFYSVLSEHWNDQLAYADTIGPYVTQGGATAVAGLVGAHLGGRVDTLRLMERAGVEASVWALAAELRKQHGPKLKEVTEQIETDAAKGQRETEERALALHDKLLREERIIREQISGGELAGARGEAMLGDVLYRQRLNLGSAYGSMQATATMVHALSQIMKKEATDKVTINFGDDYEGAKARFEELRIGRRGSIVPHPELGWQIHTTARALRKFIYTQEQNQRRNGQWEKLKGDTSSTEGFGVPLWGETFVDEEGVERPYQWRTEQRNDIQWLQEAGSGVITRVTGAGKTNTTLGYYAGLLDENPDFVGTVVIPKGRVEQWASECRKFAPELAEHLVVVPDGAKVAEVEELLLNTKPGSIVLISHRDASRRSDFLAAIEPHAITIDEPQEMLSRAAKTPKMSAGAKRIMRIETDHRVALTATPAVRAPVDVYDLVHWAFPGELGYRTRFGRAYGGFGYGTNAQDEAVQGMLWNEISPFLSGDRMSPPSFQVKKETVEVERTEWQRQALIELEANAQGWINNRKEELLAGVSDAEKARRGSTWKMQLARKFADQARQELEERQRNILRSGLDPSAPRREFRLDQTAKMQAFLQNLQEAPSDSKHVVYVDSTEQRQAITQALYNSGLGRHEVKNIASAVTSMRPADIARRKAEFTEGEARVILIDRQSSAGHNLQAGGTLHVLGTPDNAATYLQAQGRVAREPRKGDVNIRTYRHADSPYDFTDWATLDTQVKILQATAPGLFTDPESLRGEALRRSVCLLAFKGRRFLKKSANRDRVVVGRWDRAQSRAVVTAEDYHAKG